MTRRSSPESSSSAALSSRAYSSAALVSWMEQGPTTTSSRLSRPSRMLVISSRNWWTEVEALSDVGSSSSRKAGGSRTLVHLIRRSSVGKNMGSWLVYSRAGSRVVTARRGRLFVFALGGEGRGRTHDEH